MQFGTSLGFSLHLQGGIAETIPWFFQIFSAMSKDISLIFWLWHNTTGCSIQFLPISNCHIFKTFHISTYVVKTKIGLTSGSFIWQIFYFHENKKKMKVSPKVLIFCLSVLSLEPGTFSTSAQSLSTRPRKQVGKLRHIFTIYISDIKIIKIFNFC